MIERLGSLVLVVGIAAAVASAFGANRTVLLALMVVAGVAALIPVAGLSFVDLVYSVLGPLSAATFVLAAIGSAALIWPERGVDTAAGVAVMAAMVVAIAVPLYASVIAGLPVDLYRFGFSGWQLPAVCLALLAVGFWLGSPAVAIWIAAGGVLFLAGAYASRNLLDYLVDPVALALALVVLATALYSRFAG